MADRFDQVTKAIASGQLTRRQALKRAGIGAGVSLLALVGGTRTAFAERAPAGCSNKGESCSPSGPPCCKGQGTCPPTGGYCR